MSHSCGLLFLSWGLLTALSVASCGLPNYSKTTHELMGPINKQALAVEKLSELESRDPKLAIERYQEVLAQEANFNQSIVFYQAALRDDLERMQMDPESALLTKDAITAFPVVYDRRLQSLVAAHQGLGRIYLSRNEFDNAEQEALKAITLTKDKAINPIMLSTNLNQSYGLLHKIYGAQGRTGKALLAKLNSDLLGDYLESEGALQEFYAQKRLLEGPSSAQQMREVASLVKGANDYRLNKRLAELQAQRVALDRAEAAIHTAGAQYLLAKSGGVVTPEVQRLQARAQLAQMQADMSMRLAEVSARQGNKLQRDATPWAIPTFTQQLVDPRQGANTPTIMKGFATNAAQAGGPSYQAGAQQVTQAVDSLAPYRQSGKLDGAAAQVEKFAEVFNAFLTQVQEIKAGK